MPQDSWSAVSYNIQSPEAKNVNLAYHKAAGAYKLYTKDSGPKTAVDGYREGLTTYKSCALGGANWGSDNFFYVDLGATYDIDRIIHTNRLGYAYRGKDFWILATDMFFAHDTRKGNQTRCIYQAEKLKDGVVTQYKCPRNVKGRYIVVLKYPGNDYLQVCELEVYDKNTFENLSLDKPASFSHTSTKPASYAVDGYWRYSTTLTPGCAVNDNKQINRLEWWAVDLQQMYHVRYMHIGTADVAKTLAMNKLKIAVQKKFQKGMLDSDFVICLTVTKALTAKTAYTVFCQDRAIGRYVVIQKDNAAATTIVPLTLCEVEVYGDVPHENVALNKPTTTVGGGLRKEIAVDGSHKSGTSVCFASPKKANNEWWAVDLLDDYIVNTVTIYFQTDQDNFSVYVKAGTVNQLCHKQTNKLKAGYVYPIRCAKPLVGDAVSVVKHNSGSAALTLCEVEVYGDIFDGNLALGKTAYQSTTYWDYKADLTNDGLALPNLADGSCSQTLSIQMDDPNRPNWWATDLGATRKLYNMKIVNSDNCGTNCLRDFAVLVTDKFDTTNFHANKYETCYDEPISLMGGVVFSFHCQRQMSGRYVVIKAPSSYQLTICEMFVYDVNYLVNVAMGKPAKSSPEDVKNPAYRATDGQTDGNMAGKACSATCGWNTEEWLSIDLLARYRVWEVVVHSKIDKTGTGLQDFDVHTADTFDLDTFQNSPHNSYICHSQKEELDIGSNNLRCQGEASGRYVVFWKDNKAKSPLVLCEVEVFGTLLQAGHNNVAVGKAVTLSDKGNGARATDGRTHPNDVFVCAKTSGALDTEWLAVDLGQTYEVSGAAIVNRHSCCDKAQLGDIELITTRDLHIDDVKKGAYYQCAERTHPMGKGHVMNFPCGRFVRGRYFIVIKTKAKTAPLVVCEVEVYGKAVTVSGNQNLALNKNATQSSEVSKTARTAATAVDGNLKPDIAGGACAKTSGNQDFEWWSVALNDTYMVERVVVVADTAYNNLTILVAYDDFEPRDLNVKFPGAFVASNYVYGAVSAATTAGPTTAGSTDSTAASTASTAAASTTTTAAPTTTPYVPVTTFSACGVMTFTAKLGEIRELDCKSGVIGRHIIVVKDKTKGKPLILCEFEAYGTVPPPTTTSTTTTSSTTTISKPATTTTTTVKPPDTTPGGQRSGQASGTSSNSVAIFIFLVVALGFGCAL
ncbi:uncharacterized protein LOC135498333 [Lineus longissimus]|uniref:uncharacterized protein LOC135498333 n=1 Tax=Lineus longissimus TaxID=88925 RepID=UPI00315DEDDB